MREPGKPSEKTCLIVNLPFMCVRAAGKTLGHMWQVKSCLLQNVLLTCSSSCPSQGCNPFAQTGRSKLQNKRAGLNQQIIKQMRIRAGAENLLK